MFYFVGSKFFSYEGRFERFIKKFFCIVKREFFFMVKLYCVDSFKLVFCLWFGEVCKRGIGFGLFFWVYSCVDFLGLGLGFGNVGESVYFFIVVCCFG